MNNHKKLENWYFFAKKASQVVVKIKSELLDRKKETSPTCCNFEIFDHDPQLDIKFWNLTSNFEIHKNIGENFDYIYRFMYTLSIYIQSMKKLKDIFRDRQPVPPVQPVQPVKLGAKRLAVWLALDPEGRYAVSH